MTNILVVVLKVVICVLVAYLVIFKLLGVRVVRNDEFAIVERWWSSRKSADDSIISMDGETGYLPDVLRGGIQNLTDETPPYLPETYTGTTTGSSSFDNRGRFFFVGATLRY